MAPFASDTVQPFLQSGTKREENVGWVGHRIFSPSVRCKKTDGIIIGLWLIVSLPIIATVFIIKDEILPLLPCYGDEPTYGILLGVTMNWDLVRMLLSNLLYLLSYSIILIPGWAVLKYAKSRHFENGMLSCIITPCVSGFGVSESVQNNKALPPLRRTIKLTISICGLLIPFIVWGLLQEKIMTSTYQDNYGINFEFSYAEFPVFVSSTFAFAMSLIYVKFDNQQPRYYAPLISYSLCSLSSVISHVCQFEALKFVQFPTQSLIKTLKIIPVMAMGKLISRKKYKTYEHVMVLIVFVGVAIFMYGNQAFTDGISIFDRNAGIALLVAHLASEAYTRNGQEELMRDFGMSPIQMMCGVNLFCSILTLSSLLLRGKLFRSFMIMFDAPRFMMDCFMLGLCYAIGEVFVCYTIFNFGTMMLAILSTFRIIISIFLSCATFNHSMHSFVVNGEYEEYMESSVDSIMPSGILGGCFVFGALALKLIGDKRNK